MLASAVKVKMGLWGARSIPHPGGFGSVGAPRAQAAPSATCRWLCHVPMLLRGSWPTRVRVRGTMSTETTPRGVDSASTLSEALVSVCFGVYQRGAHMGTLLGHLGGSVATWAVSVASSLQGPLLSLFVSTKPRGHGARRRDDAWASQPSFPLMPLSSVN